MKKEAKKVDRQRKTQQMKEEKKSEEAQPPKEKKDVLEKKSDANLPLEKVPNKYEKQVAKLIRQNMDVSFRCLFNRRITNREMLSSRQ